MRIRKMNSTITLRSLGAVAIAVAALSYQGTALAGNTACLKVYAGELGTFNIANICENNKIAVVRWTDGNIRRYLVGAGSYYSERMGNGYAKLLGETD